MSPTWVPPPAAPAERKKVLLRIADLIDRHALEPAVRGNGTKIYMAIKAEPGSATFRHDDCPGIAQGPGPDPPRTFGHGRGHRVLKLSHDVRRLQDCRSLGGRQFGGAETGGTRLALVVAPDLDLTTESCAVLPGAGDQGRGCAWEYLWHVAPKWCGNRAIAMTSPCPPWTNTPT